MMNLDLTNEMEALRGISGKIAVALWDADEAERNRLLDLLSGAVDLFDRYRAVGSEVPAPVAAPAPEPVAPEDDLEPEDAVRTFGSGVETASYAAHCLSHKGKDLLLEIYTANPNPEDDGDGQPVKWDKLPMVKANPRSAARVLQHLMTYGCVWVEQNEGTGRTYENVGLVAKSFEVLRILKLIPEPPAAQVAEEPAPVSAEIPAPAPVDLGTDAADIVAAVGKPPRRVGELAEWKRRLHRETAGKLIRIQRAGRVKGLTSQQVGGQFGRLCQMLESQTGHRPDRDAMKAEAAKLEG